MAVLKSYSSGARASSGEIRDIILTIDGSTVGTIEKTPGGSFVVKTKGLLPAIDGITGSSVDRVWSKISDKVRNREVVFTKIITDVQDAHRT